MEDEVERRREGEEEEEGERDGRREGGRGGGGGGGGGVRDNRGGPFFSPRKRATAASQLLRSK
eukprot:2166386-Pyramimonas_sp.AAC.1